MDCLSKIFLRQKTQQIVFFLFSRLKTIFVCAPPKMFNAAIHEILYVSYKPLNITGVAHPLKYLLYYYCYTIILIKPAPSQTQPTITSLHNPYAILSITFHKYFQREITFQKVNYDIYLLIFTVVDSRRDNTGKSLVPAHSIDVYA